MINRVVRCQRSSVTPNLDFGVTELSPMSSTYCVRSLRAICLQQLSFLCSVFKPPLATAIESGLVHRCCPSVRLSVCLSVVKIQKKRNQFRAMVSIDDLQAFQRTHYWTPKIQDGGDPKSMSLSCHIAGCKNFIRQIEICLSPYFIFFVFCS